MTFYEGRNFPPNTKGHFRERARLLEQGGADSAYEVIRVPVTDGKANGNYEDFLTGFRDPERKCLGPAGGGDGLPDGPCWFPTTAPVRSGGLVCGFPMKVLALVALVLYAAPGFGQVTGAISGTVEDQAGGGE